MIAKAFWISATHTNTNSCRKLLRSYKAFVYFGSRTSRPRPRLLTLPAQGGVASGVREDGKRSKRGHIRARLRANPTRLALPTLMLSNVRSLENKLDLIQLSRSTQHEARDCCVFVFTETWLNDNIPDSAIQLNRLTCYRADRDTTLSGKSRGGGLCLYINKEWCNNAAVALFGQRMLPQHYRTAFSAQTGTCLKRWPPTTTTQTCSSTLKL